MRIPAGTLADAVVAWSARSPEAIALTGVEGDLTYAELVRRSGRWAADLAEHGVGPGKIVPLTLPRGQDLVVAIVAVLRTGAATTILDPSWPSARLEHIVRAVDAPLVAGASVADRSAWYPPPSRRGAVDESRAVWTDGASRPAAVFFTSGTTGDPKGVVASHAAIARLFAPGTFARFGPGEVVPLAAASPWDAFAFELWAALANGGTSVVVTEPHLAPEVLRRCVAQYGATTAWLTSSLLNVVADEDVGALTGLRQLITGGERLSPEHVRRVLGRHSGIAMANGYGPTEGTVFTTTHRITTSDCDRPDGIPIGRPVPGTRVLTLDGERPCRPGEEGEICITGSGLAEGYLDDIAATALRFPTLTLDGRATRVYRSGDLGVVDGNGVLHFRGRLDDQVKIRGHRVEPAGVEAGLRRLLPEVTACRVLARRDGRGVATGLVAYCSPAAPSDAAERVASALAGPERPVAFRSVAAFPLTATGKLDLTALADMGEDVPDHPAVRATGEDPLVALVVEVFSAVLEVDAVSSNVSFVDLGGTSLAASRVCARIGGALGRAVPASAMASHETAEALAGWLRETSEADEAPATDRTLLAPLSDLQRGFLLRALLDPHDSAGICRLLWTVDGELDTAALDHAVGYVHRRHEALRATYVTDPALGALVGDRPPPAVAVLEAHLDTEAALAALADHLSAPLAPDNGEVWRVARVPVLGRGNAIGCAVHHIAFDGASESILAGDLAVGYRGALGEQSTRDSPIATLAEAAHAHARGRSRGRTPGDAERRREELADVPPMRWPVPGEGPTDVATTWTVLEPDLVAAIDHEAVVNHTSRFVVLLDAWARAFAGLTDVYEFVVGVPISQRDDARTLDAVGCYVATVPVRLLVKEGHGRQGTEEAVRLAMAAQDVPLSQIVRPGSPSTTRPLVYQVLFALQDNAQPRLDLPGMVTRFHRAPYVALPLELHTEVWPRQDGGLEVVVSWQTDLVPACVGGALGPALAEVLSVVDVSAVPR